MIVAFTSHIHYTKNHSKSQQQQVSFSSETQSQKGRENNFQIKSEFIVDI